MNDAVRLQCRRFELAVMTIATLLCKLSLSALEPGANADGPTTSAICSVRREQYVASPAPKAAPDVAVTYVGSGLRRREIHSVQTKSDVAEKLRVRYSEDNGRTWGALSPLDTGSDTLKQHGNGQEILSFSVKYDPVAKRTIEMLFHRIYLGDAEAAINATFRGDQKYFDHGMYRLSSDDGQTWTAPKPLTYEAGAPFNHENWADPAYLKTNQMYGGYDVVTMSDGRLAYPAVVPVAYQEDEEDRRVCKRVPWRDFGKGYVHGVMCFIGTWNEAKGDYDWTHSQPVYVARRVSTRGLEEPALAQLSDGSLLLEMRGSNARLDPLKYPGRKWISQSKDGGRSWSAVTDLRYDSGEQFEAPASFARMIRSSKTGKLYWVGNVSRTPAKGNDPRYPLYIAEVDETRAALKKNTLTVIDDRRPTDTDAVQLSNFSLLENRETRDLEIHLTRYGERPDHVFSADAYKYTLKLLP